MLQRAGIPFRTHAQDLPGLPDIVIDASSLVIMVHGCFWHRHSCRFGRVVPRRRRHKWVSAFQRRVERDRRIVQQLRALGWRVHVEWECQINSHPQVVEGRVVELARYSHMVPSARVGDRKQIGNTRLAEGNQVGGETEDSMTSHDPEERAPTILWAVYSVLALLVIVCGVLVASHAASLDAAALLAESAKQSRAQATAELEDIKTQIHHETEELAHVRDSLNPLRAEYSSLEDAVIQYRQKSGKLAELESAAEALQSRMTEDRRALQELQDRKDEALKAARQAQETQLVARSALTAMQGDLASAREELATVRTELRETHEEERKLEKAILELTKQQTAIQREHDEVVSVVARRDEYQRSVRDLEARAVEVREALAAQEAKLSKLEFEESRHIRAVGEQNARVTQLTSEEQAAKRRLDDATREFAKVTSEADVSKADGVRFKEARSAAERDLHQLEQGLTRAKQESQVEQQTLAASRIEVERLKREVVGLSDDITVYTAQRDAIRSELAALRTERESVRADQLLTEQVRGLAKALADLIDRMGAHAVQADGSPEGSESDGGGGE